MTFYTCSGSKPKATALLVHAPGTLSLSIRCLHALFRPDSVDAALRRPGRFDRELCVDLPGPQDRAAILQVTTLSCWLQWLLQCIWEVS